MKKRSLFYEILPNLSHKNALVITGMRQVGKTTLMRQLYEEPLSGSKLWFDLDNPLDQKVFEDIDYNNIYTRLRDLAGGSKERLYVFVDEIQNFPEITKIIKFLIDHYGVKFVVTGSSNYYLKNLFPESLSGRKFLYHLTPLSFREFLYFHDKLSEEEARLNNTISILHPISIFDYKKFAEEYSVFMRFGGFPEVATTSEFITKSQILKNIFASFFEKDLKILSDYADIRELRDLILLLVPRIGSMLDVTKLSIELGVARQKIYSYLEFLQGVFFIRLVPKFSKSIDRSVAGGRRVYFTDTGLLNTLGNVNDSQLFENAVVNQLASYGEISFYNHRHAEEIDIILNKKIALEVKLTGTSNDVKQVNKLASKIGLAQAKVVSYKFADLKDIISPVNF
ncbi:MAG: ATPase [Candidatus Magasanikbacteria bacterium GW2011_GWA2_37_8]|uniref:ATPase n=1 Tax=Candidatus Magasanikbacteria bacterium GW2011_GWA2_37_8 TaxID=1619036 RepID=A0A0G0JUM4_9BACT|nr:MAG: ATPase [Candidatus Magasanikbacteria bacterium GW2011_GWA2_37_8]